VRIFKVCSDQSVPEIVGNQPRPELVILALTFIGPSGSSYIQNPHLKAKLTEMMYFGTLKHQRVPYGLFGDILNSNAFALEWTFPSVMSFYIGQFPILCAYNRGGTHRFAFSIL
jgi:Ubiquitin elongating factor core